MQGLHIADVIWEFCSFNLLGSSCKLHFYNYLVQWQVRRLIFKTKYRLLLTPKTSLDRAVNKARLSAGSQALLPDRQRGLAGIFLGLSRRWDGKVCQGSVSAQIADPARPRQASQSALWLVITKPKREAEKCRPPIYSLEGYTPTASILHTVCISPGLSLVLMFLYFRCTRA